MDIKAPNTQISLYFQTSLPGTLLYTCPLPYSSAHGLQHHV